MDRAYQNNDQSGNLNLDIDEDTLLTCPLDPAHQIIRSRMNRHIMKCLKNYHGPELKFCPFNSMHLFTEDKIRSHMLLCPDAPNNSKIDSFSGF